MHDALESLIFSKKMNEIMHTIENCFSESMIRYVHVYKLGTIIITMHALRILVPSTLVVAINEIRRFVTIDDYWGWANRC